METAWSASCLFFSFSQVLPTVTNDFLFHFLFKRRAIEPQLVIWRWIALRKGNESLGPRLRERVLMHGSSIFALLVMTGPGFMAGIELRLNLRNDLVGRHHQDAIIWPTMISFLRPAIFPEVINSWPHDRALRPRPGNLWKGFHYLKREKTEENEILFKELFNHFLFLVFSFFLY